MQKGGCGHQPSGHSASAGIGMNDVIYTEGINKETNTYTYHTIARYHSSEVSSKRKILFSSSFLLLLLVSTLIVKIFPARLISCAIYGWVLLGPPDANRTLTKKIYSTLACFESCAPKKNTSFLFLISSLQFFLPTGLLYIHIAQNPTKPDTVAPMPEIQGQAPEMTKLRGHSSCAK